MKTVEEPEAQLEGARVMVDSLTRSLELAEADVARVEVDGGEHDRHCIVVERVAFTPKAR